MLPLVYLSLNEAWTPTNECGRTVLKITEVTRFLLKRNALLLCFYTYFSAKILTYTKNGKRFTTKPRKLLNTLKVKLI